jgi:hypothetical protein
MKKVRMGVPERIHRKGHSHLAAASITRALKRMGLDVGMGDWSIDGWRSPRVVDLELDIMAGWAGM